MQLYVVAKILQSVFLEFKCAGLKALARLKTLIESEVFKILVR